LSVDESLRERIHEANVALHRSEAEYYELLHPEIYGKPEQKRIDSTLKILDRLVTDSKKRALDFGAGTGNITGKLLNMGYNVTAVDISDEMCNILKKKHKPYLESEKLRIINSPVEEVDFDKGEFDLITCYSVLHHLPDYLDAIRRLSFFLKKGGVMYLDHEASPFYWKHESNSRAYWIKQAYFHSNRLLNYLYLRTKGVNIPSLDYDLSDYWHKKEHPIDHEKIESIFRKERFAFFKRQDYYINSRTWISNPIFYPYRYACKPEMSLWMAKK
jgi:2-polyprenyl-3-methyl-5-hydroxy-6-metoxy-1,4-benzoquinol methylase